MVISMAVAAPKFTQQIKRDREIEMIHRGEQYARAIKRYYKKTGRYPTRIEELENTNNIRFLRKRYKDPMTPDGKWRLVRYGEVQLGQSGAGGGTVGTPAGQAGNSPSGAATGDAGGGTPSGASAPSTGDTGSSSGFSSGGSSSGFGSSFGGGSGGSLFGGSSGSSGSLFGSGSGTTGTTGSSGSSLFGSSGSTTGTAGAGQTFGGGPIVGVASLSEKQGIHEFNNKKQYNQWLFVYDPTQDPQGTRLIKGPYNPKAFVGTAQGGIGQPVGGGTGATGLGGGPQGQPNPTPNPATPFKPQ